MSLIRHYLKKLNRKYYHSKTLLNDILFQLPRRLLLLKDDPGCVLFNQAFLTQGLSRNYPPTPVYDHCSEGR